MRSENYNFPKNIIEVKLPSSLHLIWMIRKLQKAYHTLVCMEIKLKAVHRH